MPSSIRFDRLPSVLTFYARLQLQTHRSCATTGSPVLVRGTAQPCKSLAVEARQHRAAKRRLDEVCFQLHPELSKPVIQSWIAQGKVLVNNRVVDKAGAQVQPDAAILLTAKQEKYVCRAGHKLEAALDHFGIDVTGKRVLDSGISTGGFTDCLLQRGAAAVIGVDVGYGQVAERVRVDKRVTVMERTNVRHLRLADLPGSLPVQMVTLDLSFISVQKVVQGVQELMTPDAGLVILIKPQFEAERHQVQAGGTIKDPAVHEEIIAKVCSAVETLGFSCQGCIPSPLPGAVSRNQEFLAYFLQKQLTHGRLLN